MIVACEKCNAKFNLDENLIKEGGSKVRCSSCRHVFVVYPPRIGLFEEDSSDEFLEETVALDLPPDFSDIDVPQAGKMAEEAFEKAFEDALDEVAEKESLDEAFLSEDHFDEPFDEKEPEREIFESIAYARKGSQARGLLIPLVVILALIVVGISIFFFIPELLPDSLSFLKPVKKEELVDSGIRRLDFQKVSGSFLNSVKAGQLFVIRGEIINNNPDSRSRILLKGSILDNTGKSIRQRLIYAGNTFPDKELKEMALEDVLRALKNSSGQGDMNVNVRSGSSIPFLIVFENLPDNLGEFVVEAVSSSPGK
ncbi:MAG: zinc-ribbon domain-containing protein [Deltaproteobacteria bacterium]|nr:zinc-ribbon domain-containing protein [Deltaproteobacteria bacterium]